MNADHLTELLRDAPVPRAAGARERTVIAAMAELERGPAQRARDRRHIGALGIAAVTALLVTVALTPPGRAVAHWLGELVGVVGGAPTLEQRPVEALTPPTVIGTGAAPDGTPYEVITHGSANETACLELDWPEQKETTGVCYEGDLIRPVDPTMLSSPSRGDASIPTSLSGLAMGKVEAVQARYETPDGEIKVAPVDLLPVPPTVRKEVGADDPVKFFIAFLPRSLAAEDLALGRARIEVSGYDAQGRVIGRKLFPPTPEELAATLVQ